MRHRGQSTEDNTPRTTLTGVTGTLQSLTEMLASQDVAVPAGGKHRGLQLIPTQAQPADDTASAEAVDTPVELAVADGPVVEAPVFEAPVFEAPVVEAPVFEAPPAPVMLPVREIPVQRAPFETTRFEPAPTAPAPFDWTRFQSGDDEVTEDRTAGAVPHVASWKASHLPRIVAGLFFAGSVVGTAALAVRFAQARQSDSMLALVVGIAVTVVLWAVLIASTPQVVSLNGSILTVRNSRGSERFDLADSLQPVDVVDHPRSSQWAVLLHRADRTSVVLRHSDVKADEFDPIVRHYRRIADRSYAEREARFNR